MTVWLQFAHLTGAPIVLAFVVLFVPGNALVFQRVRLGARASRQACLILDVSEDDRPPVSGVAAFDHWREQHAANRS